MDWSHLLMFGDTFIHDGHYRSVAHVVRCTSRLKGRMTLKISCLHLLLRWATGSGFVWSSFNRFRESLPEGWKCYAHGHRSAYFSLYTAPLVASGCGSWRMFFHSCKAENLSRATLLEVADPVLVDSFLSTSMGSCSAQFRARVCSHAGFFFDGCSHAEDSWSAAGCANALTAAAFDTDCENHRDHAHLGT